MIAKCRLKDLDLGEALLSELSSNHISRWVKTCSHVFTFVFCLVVLSMVYALCQLIVEVSVTQFSVSLFVSTLFIWMTKKHFIPLTFYRYVLRCSPYGKWVDNDKRVLLQIKSKLVKALQLVDISEYRALASACSSDIEIMETVFQKDRSTAHLNACLCSSFFILSTLDMLSNLQKQEAEHAK